MPGGPQINFTASTAVQTSDGRIWFATDNGLTWIDPARITKNNLPPPVVVKSLTTDEKTYQSVEIPELPKGTESLRINYTALSLSVPERVRFKYRLEGVDDDWRDVGTRREAFFTNLGPGTYRFRVIASNNDGVWNEEGAALEFTILPRFYQTNLFLVLCAATLVFMALLGYRWRVRQVKNLLRLQFQERLAERTRIAQDLHDTLLQGFQFLFLPINYGILISDKTLPMVTDLGGQTELKSGQQAWLVWEGTAGVTYLVQTKDQATEKRSLITLPKIDVKKTEITAYDPVLRTLFVAQTCSE